MRNLIYYYVYTREIDDNRRNSYNDEYIIIYNMKREKQNTAKIGTDVVYRWQNQKLHIFKIRGKK